jgi:amino acid adenylation domain-containing protein
MSEQVLHHVFKDWVRQCPLALAVTGGTERLTYAELDDRANRLAGALVGAGVRKEEPVVMILLERGPTLVASLLGTLGAGGAFVCVDPRLPWQRIRQLLATARPKAIIADQASWARHGRLIRAELPEVRWLIAGDPLEAQWTVPSVIVEPGDRAYIAFTSGSTGQPKGIPHCHATLSHFVAWQGAAFGIEPATRMAQLAPQGFDVSYCEIFGALCRGASLHIAPDSLRSDPAELARWLREEQISLLQIIPAHWRALLTDLPDTEAHPLPDLSTVMFVGEALTLSLIAESRARLRPAPRFVNVYGPTEVVAATYYEVGDISDDLLSVPIGRPIPGREIILVGDAGEEGEIHIRSRFLTTGYLDNAVETRQRFIQNPQHADYPDLVFRTGDLARRLPGGDLMFVGRRDNQVKILGYRIELEEVEAAILGTGGVSEAVATVRRRGEDIQSLIAFVVLSGNVDPDTIRRGLAEILPGHMVPAALVPVEQLPHNANGKIDRDTVREWDAPLPADEGEPEPGSELEEVIAEIWRDLLGVASVGRHVDLFALGGNSLLATRLISRVRALLGVKVALGAFFETPTIAGLAAAVSTAPRNTTPLVRRVG